MFNIETVNFLKHMSKISNSVVLEYPVTTGRTESADIAYQFDLRQFDTDGFDGQVGIWDLSSFLNMFGLFSNEREVSLSDNIFTLKDSESSANYLTTNLEVLSQFSFKKEQFDKLDTFPDILKCDLSIQDIKKLLSSASVFKDIDTVVISCDEDTVIGISNVGEFKQSSNSYKIVKSEKSTKNFKVVIDLGTLAKIPLQDYELIVKYNEAKNAYRILLKSKSIEGFMMIISTRNI